MQDKKYKIDVTITATLRVSIFKKTIGSFFKYMFERYLNRGNILNLILNIDPIGNEGFGQEFHDCIQGRFNKFLIHVPEVPSFPKAFKHVWDNVAEDTDYVFHLEDDWKLMQDINIFSLLRILDSEEDLALLRLAAFHAGPNSPIESWMKNWNKFFPYNGRYYECPEEMKAGLGFCGHPSLIKAEFVRNTAKFLDDQRNPEKQFHSRGRTKIMQEVEKWRYGVYSMPGYPPLIRDIGRKWMVKNNFRKEGTKAHFTQWERVEIEK